MTDQPTDHRAEAEEWLHHAKRTTEGDPHATVAALIGIGHALLAEPAAVNMRIRDGQWETMPDDYPANLYRQVADYVNAADPDIRCGNTSIRGGGQCLDHQGHLGEHQYPADR